MSNNKSVLNFKEFKIFYDGQKNGYDAYNASVALVGDELYTVFFSGAYDDDEAGAKSYLIKSKDMAKTWTSPEIIGPKIIEIQNRESMIINNILLTSKGTLLVNGCHMKLGDTAGKYYENLALRRYTMIIGRKEKHKSEFSYKLFPYETFMEEKFMERGVELDCGRLIYGIWGSRKQEENWRCGVLISDDDGITWNYRDVGYEPDLGIRDITDTNNQDAKAGFNEQSLFYTGDKEIVSIIRGRAKLGCVASSPMDTWFFRSISRDNGETWSKPELTDIAGTGAALVGLVLPDGSLLHACRIPYSRDLYKLPEPEFFGLHFARSYDKGKTWITEKIIQHDPEGNSFKRYYDAMNGQFLKINNREFLYIFGHFGYNEKKYRLLSVKININ